MVTPSSNPSDDHHHEMDGITNTTAAARRRSFTSLWSNDDDATTRGATDKDDPTGSGGRVAHNDDMEDDGTWKDYEYDFAEDDDEEDAQAGQRQAGVVNNNVEGEDDNDTWAEYTLRDEGYDDEDEEEERGQRQPQQHTPQRYTYSLNDDGGGANNNLNLYSPKNNHHRPTSSRSLGSSSDNDTLGENTLGGDTLVNLARAENDMDGMSLNEDEGNDVDTLAADTLTLVTEAQTAGNPAAGAGGGAAIIPFGGGAPQRSQWALDDVVGAVPATAGALVPVNKNPSGIDIMVPSPDRTSAGGTEETASNSSGLRDYKYPGGGDFSLASSTPTRNNGTSSNGKNRNRRNYRASGGKVEDKETKSSAFGFASHILNSLRGKGGGDGNENQRRGSERNLIRNSSPANYDDEEVAGAAGAASSGGPPNHQNRGRGRAEGFCGLMPELFRELPIGIRAVVVVALLTMIGSLAFLAVAGVRSGGGGGGGKGGGDVSSALAGDQDGMPNTATFPPPPTVTTPDDAGGVGNGGDVPGQSSSTPSGADGNGNTGIIDGQNNTRTSAPASDLTVGVYYYPWYTDANDFHGGRYLRKVLRPEQSPTLDEYSYDVGIEVVDGDRGGNRDSSTPSAVVRRHAQWSRNANIKLWVTSWWGPGSEEDRVVLDRILNHPDLTASPSSSASNGVGGGSDRDSDDEIKIALHYETTNRLNDEDGDLDLDVLYEDVRYMVREYFDNYNYYRIDDRPVVFVHRTHDLSRRGVLVEVIKTMREAADDGGYRGGIYIVGDEAFGDVEGSFDAPEAVDVLDAITDFDVYGSMMGIAEGGRHHLGRDGLDRYVARQERWRELADRRGRGYVPGVIPGFNDRVVRYDLERTALSRKLESEEENESGSLFRALLRRAVRSVNVERADGLLMINSWNEWHSDTQIEPVGSLGDVRGDGKDDEGGDLILSPRDVDGGDGGGKGNGRIFDSTTSTDLSPTGMEYTQGLRYESYGERYLDILREETVAMLLS